MQLAVSFSSQGLKSQHRSCSNSIRHRSGRSQLCLPLALHIDRRPERLDPKMTKTKRSSPSTNTCSLRSSGNDYKYVLTSSHTSAIIEYSSSYGNQVERLLKDPTKEVHLPKGPREKQLRPPKEMIKNVSGSSAGVSERSASSSGSHQFTDRALSLYSQR
jgi:hypothetical protein